MCCSRGPHQGVSHEEYARLPHAGNLRLGRQLGSVTASPAASCIGWRKWIPGDKVRGGGVVKQSLKEKFFPKWLQKT